MAAVGPPSRRRDCSPSAEKHVHIVLSMEVLDGPNNSSPHRRVTVRQRYSNMFAELLSLELFLGHRADKRPDLFYVFFSRDESVVTNDSVAVYIRVFGWFFLFQAWCTLRFEDHRGLELASIRDSTEAFSAGAHSVKNSLRWSTCSIGKTPPHNPVRRQGVAHPTAMLLLDTSFASVIPSDVLRSSWCLQARV